MRPWWIDPVPAGLLAAAFKQWHTLDAQRQAGCLRNSRDQLGVPLLDAQRQPVQPAKDVSPCSGPSEYCQRTVCG